MRPILALPFVALVACGPSPDVGVVTQFNGDTVTVRGALDLDGKAGPQLPKPNQRAEAVAMCDRFGKSAEYVSSNVVSDPTFPRVDFLFSCL